MGNNRGVKTAFGLGIYCIIRYCPLQFEYCLKLTLNLIVVADRYRFDFCMFNVWGSLKRVSIFLERIEEKLLASNSVVKLYCMSVCIYLDKRHKASGGSLE